MKSNVEEYKLSYATHVTDTLAKRTATKQAAFLLPHLKPNMHILDCGSGPGSISCGLAKAVPQGKVLGIDIADSQVALAQQRAQTEQIDNIDFAQANVYQLSHLQGQFDVVFMNVVLSYLHDKKAALQQLKQTLKPGGMLAIRDADFGGFIAYPEAEILQEARAMRFKALNANGADFYTGRKLNTLLLEAGANQVQMSASCETYNTPEQLTPICDYLAKEWHSPYRKIVLENGWANEARIAAYQQAWLDFAKIPGAFRSSLWCEAIGYF